MFPLADKDDWDPLFTKLDTLNRATDVLDAESLTDRQGKLVLSKCITDLEEAAAARDALGAMQATNQITLIAADLSDQFHPQTPADVARLAYYSRALKIGAEQKDTRQLELTAKSMQETWNHLRPEVVKRPGGLRHGGAHRRVGAAGPDGRVARPVCRRGHAAVGRSGEAEEAVHEVTPAASSPAVYWLPRHRAGWLGSDRREPPARWGRPRSTPATRPELRSNP